MRTAPCGSYYTHLMLLRWVFLMQLVGYALRFVRAVCEEVARREAQARCGRYEGGNVQVAVACQTTVVHISSGYAVSCVSGSVKRPRAKPSSEPVQFRACAGRALVCGAPHASHLSVQDNKKYSPFLLNDTQDVIWEENPEIQALSCTQTRCAPGNCDGMKSKWNHELNPFDVNMQCDRCPRSDL